LNNSIVFIDGAYLNLIIKEIFSAQRKLDIKQLSILLARQQGFWCRKSYYYTAPPYQSRKTTPMQDKRKSSYDRFVSTLKKKSGVIVREGRCQKTSSGFRQKGVDTLLTIDLLMSSLKGKCKTAILLACDTDFVPVMEYLKKELGVEVIVYYYADRRRSSRFSMSNHMISACDKAIKIDINLLEHALSNDEP
jgi:uncharacterized LabA/DUF88 family protein